MTAREAAEPTGWESRPGESRLPLMGAIVWAIILIPAAAGVYQRHYRLGWAVLGYASVAAFFAAYYMIFTRGAVHRRRGEPVPGRLRIGGYALLCALAFLVVGFTGENGVVVWFGLSQISLVLMPRRDAWGSIGSICVAVVLVPWTLGLDWEINLWFVVAILGSAWATDNIFRVRAANQKLSRAQEQIAAMAVERERLRFSRDLHDIIGHSLTAATMKTQLALRVLDTDRDQARAEMGDVEALIREALADVRATVAGYREVTLSAEIVRAATILEAAEIHAELPGTVDEVPGEYRELFGWILRESVTNVVKHSSATRCRVTVTAGSIEIWNDRAEDGGPGAIGSGLSGLRERVEAAGGRMEAGPDSSGGWRVRAMMSR